MKTLEKEGDKMDKMGKMDYMNLKKIREVNKLTQEQVAEIMDVQRETISNYERGERVLPLLKLNKILDFLGLTLENYKNKEFKSRIEIAYRKNELDKDYQHVIWLNKFVNNLEFIKRIN